MSETKIVSIFILKSGLTLFVQKSVSQTTPIGRCQIAKTVKKNLLNKQFDLFVHSTEKSAITSLQIIRSLLVFNERCLEKDPELKNPKINFLEWLKKTGEVAIQKNPGKEHVKVLATSNSIVIPGKKISIPPASIIKYELEYSLNGLNIFEPIIITS